MPLGLNTRLDALRIVRRGAGILSFLVGLVCVVGMCGRDRRVGMVGRGEVGGVLDGLAWAGAGAGAGRCLSRVSVFVVVLAGE